MAGEATAVTALCLEGSSIVVHGMNEVHAIASGALQTGTGVVHEILRLTAAQNLGAFTTKGASAQRIVDESGSGAVRYNPQTPVQGQ